MTVSAKPADASTAGEKDKDNVPQPTDGAVDTEVEVKPTEVNVVGEKPLDKPKKRFSLPFSKPDTHEHHVSIQTRESSARLSFARRLVLSTSKEKRDKHSALVIRELIIGGNKQASVQVTKTEAQRLAKPSSANRVIAQLRLLDARSNGNINKDASGKAPIRAVCLEHPDGEEHTLHIGSDDESWNPVEAFSQMHIVDFLQNSIPSPSAPNIELPTTDEIYVSATSLLADDMGLGKPANSAGILSGALPTAQTIIQGIEQITPQLMSLSYATGAAILPDHHGVYPPTDRMSLITYWWGLEITLPPPSITYLGQVQSISGTVLNFLSAVAMVNGGVREILPFVRYISQFIDWEFSNIKAVNEKGGRRGVVCAATWIMPAALVPRPWDFSDKPKNEVPKGPIDTSSPTIHLPREDDQKQGEGEEVGGETGDVRKETEVDEAVGDNEPVSETSPTVSKGTSPSSGQKEDKGKGKEVPTSPDSSTSPPGLLDEVNTGVNVPVVIGIPTAGIS